MRDPHLHPVLGMRSLGLLAVAVLPSLIASVVGSLFTARGLVGWYPALQKPFFNPPNAVFPFVWTFLYALMALSFWRILRAREGGAAKIRAILAFLAQMALNLGWSYVFFGLRSPYAGLAVIGALLVAIVVTMRLFRPIDAPASYALIPYLAWVGFATTLNGAIALLN